MLNSYKLSDKQQDQDFLAGKPVAGPAVFLSDEFRNSIVQNGDRIVIILSNGKKYMGKVLRFTYDSKGDVVEGLMEVIKA